jgi:hypothetical protein
MGVLAEKTRGDRATALKNKFINKEKTIGREEDGTNLRY